jgi:hypothetical protein
MRASEDDIRAAAAEAGIDGAQAGRLIEALRGLPARSGDPVRFDLVHLLWYAGALIVIGAMGLFTTLAFEQMGGRALTVTALVNAALFVAAGHCLWFRHSLRTPGGLLIAVAVAMAPLATYGIQDSLDLWGAAGDPGRYRDFYVWIKGSWVPMEVATIAAGVLALVFYPFPFIVAVIAVALWFLSMDLAPWFLDREVLSWAARRRVSMVLGLAVLAMAWIVDVKRRQEQDFAFWLHLAGLAAFWGGLTLADSSTVFGKALYALLNVGLVGLSVYLMRRAYAVFGAVGVAMYLGYLANVVFKNSLLFPFALSLIGVAIIGLGLVLHRRRAALSAWIENHLPSGLRRLRPHHALAPA